MITNQHIKFTPIYIFRVFMDEFLLILSTLLYFIKSLLYNLLVPIVDNLFNIKFGTDLQPHSNVLITLILTLLQAFFLNRIINHFNFLGKPTFLTALLFMSLVSVFLPFLVLSPTLICNFITIWMIDKLF